ncbi:hypothetical protein [uncultured Algibacter sp.]|uniref:hypothetical protein n=1 Tax=uncultured Algibacter sp. TaxID=298659 RepID=UPI0030EC6418|tara:strand:- start:690 stop:1226 length:537 start_codon:yes stop_codon:yes gene_type:complete
MKELNVDCMKYRKSTHLAGVDVDIIIAEKGKCVLTIKESYYSTGIDVSGNKTDGYFIEFIEDVKPMVINSTNRKIVASIVKIKNKCSSTESRNIANWKGLSIELVFDESIKMMGKKTGGIRVSPISPIVKVDDKKGIELLMSSKTLKELQAKWGFLSKDEQLFPTIVALKNKLKTELK